MQPSRKKDAEHSIKVSLYYKLYTCKEIRRPALPCYLAKRALEEKDFLKLQQGL